MKGRFYLLVITLLLGGWDGVGAAGPEGNLYVLGFALDQAEAPGAWNRIGPEHAWKAVKGAVVFQNRLYTAESDGTLRATDLGNGARKQIGKPEFGNTIAMYPLGDHLYTIETDGSLFRVNPGDGTWNRIGPERAWKALRTGTIFKDRLYTAETDSTLRVTDLATGTRKKLGNPDFGDTVVMVAHGDNLFTIETNGNFFRVNPNDGGWAQIGSAGAWKRARAGAVFGNRLFTAETDGTLQATDLANGARRKIGHPEFGNTTFMFATSEALCTIETDGSLFHVNTQDNLGAFNWCPEEVVQVFREHGKPFYRDLRPRLILGKQATHAAALEGLAWLRHNATRNDLAVMYLTCHGFVDPNEGWGVVAADGKTLWGHEIKAELGRLPCPVIALIETCGSGGFAVPHKKDPPVPPNVTALCACSGKQAANNELDIALAEALYGRADYNQDGVIDLDELIRYLEDRYKEWRPEAKPGEDILRPVIVKSRTVPGSLPLTKPSAPLAAVVVEGGYWSALLEKPIGDRYQVHLLGWNSRPGAYYLANVVTRDCICLPADGPPLLVEQNGTWYPARLVKRDGASYKVHYLGYNEEEVVSRDRIKYPFAGNQK
jgi:hypothetical protein